MSVASDRQIDPLGTHRVIDPPGGTPHTATRVDNTPVALENEILVDVETLSIDSDSFKQIADSCGGDARAIGSHIAQTVRSRGKQHNPVTGTGGTFIGRVLKIGESLRDRIDLRPGDRIVSLVSLALTPLYIESITKVDPATARVWIRGKAILFESARWVKLPAEIPDDVAFPVFTVAGAPARVGRLSKPGMTVLVIGANGKSGILACAQAKRAVGKSGRVIGLAPRLDTESTRVLQRAGLVDAFVQADARNALEVTQRVSQLAPNLADLVVNCVNVPGTELSSVLCAKDEGTVYFSSRATSFTAAALGAEGVGKDVTMIIGNGYARERADTALSTLREYPQILRYFMRKYTQEGQN